MVLIAKEIFFYCSDAHWYIEEIEMQKNKSTFLFSLFFFSSFTLFVESGYVLFGSELGGKDVG